MIVEDCPGYHTLRSTVRSSRGILEEETYNPLIRYSTSLERSLARVIIMEDDPDEGVLFSQLLERGGHEVMVFPDAQSTLDHLEVSGADVLLSDIFVRKENRLVPDGGVRLISTIRQIWRVEWTTLPIIAISGGVSIQGGASPLRIARDLGADALFEKPVPIDELQLTIEELVASRIKPVSRTRKLRKDLQTAQRSGGISASPVLAGEGISFRACNRRTCGSVPEVSRRARSSSVSRV